MVLKHDTINHSLDAKDKEAIAKGLKLKAQ